MKTKTNSKRINYIFKGLIKKEERIKFLQKTREGYYLMIFISILILDATNYFEASLVMLILSIANIALLIRIATFTIAGGGSPVHYLGFLYLEESELKENMLKLNNKIKELNISNDNQGRY